MVSSCHYNEGDQNSVGWGEPLCRAGDERPFQPRSQPGLQRLGGSQLNPYAGFLRPTQTWQPGKNPTHVLPSSPLKENRGRRRRRGPEQGPGVLPGPPCPSPAPEAPLSPPAPRGAPAPRRHWPTPDRQRQLLIPASTPAPGSAAAHWWQGPGGAGRSVLWGGTHPLLCRLLGPGGGGGALGG